MKTDIHFGGEAEMKPEKVKKGDKMMKVNLDMEKIMDRIKDMKNNKDVDKEHHNTLAYEILLNSVSSLLHDLVLESEDDEETDILYDLIEEYELTSEYRQTLHFDYLYERNIEL